MNDHSLYEALRSRRTPLLLIVVSLLALGASACGESESNSPPNGSQGKGDSKPKSNAQSFTVKPGAVTGFVDSVQVTSESVSLTGWAASGDFKLVAQTVSGKVDGKTVAEAVPVLERADVASIYGKPALKQSGFELRVPLSELNCSEPGGGLTVFGSLDGVGSELEFVENTEADLSAAC